MPTSLPLIFASLTSFHGNVWITIFDRMPIEQLVLLAHLSPEVCLLVQAYMRMRWMNTLSRFMRNPEGFRDCLRFMDAIVSGSLALEFLTSTRMNWDMKDMDIYCPFGRGDYIVRYLERCEDYVLYERFSRAAIPPGRRRGYSRGISQVIQLRHADGRQIDVIVSANRSALFPLAFFWTTLLMNYISADSFCVAYPATTFCAYGCIFPSSSEKFMDVYLKYLSRGFTLDAFTNMDPEYVLVPYGTVLDDCNTYCPNQPRHFGDQWCMQLVFDVDSARGCAVDVWTPSWTCGRSRCRFCRHESEFEVDLGRWLS